MGMQRYIEAIKNLPDEYVDDNTTITGKTGLQWIIAANPNFKPIIYHKGKWEELSIYKQLEINRLKMPI